MAGRASGQWDFIDFLDLDSRGQEDGWEGLWAMGFCRFLGSESARPGECSASSAWSIEERGSASFLLSFENFKYIFSKYIFGIFEK